MPFNGKNNKKKIFFFFEKYVFITGIENFVIIIVFSENG